MWPRQLLGYGGLEEPTAVPLINGLYKEAWGPLHNFFLPSMKLKDKWREGSGWVRRHHRPPTAYQRLMASKQIRARNKRRLGGEFEALDPLQLAHGAESRRQRI